MLVPRFEIGREVLLSNFACSLFFLVHISARAEVYALLNKHLETSVASCRNVRPFIDAKVSQNF